MTADISEAQQNNSAPESTSQRLLPFCDFAGYACFAAWAFLAGWFEEFNPFHLGIVESSFLARIPFFAGAAIASILFFVFGKPSFSASSRRTLALFFALCLGCPITLITTLPQLAVTALWAISGAGSTLCFLTWSLRLKVLSKHQQLVVICGAFAISGLSLAIAPFMNPIAALIIFTALPLASFACLVFAQQLFSPKNMIEPPSKVSIRNFQQQIPFEDDRHFVYMKGLHATLYSTFLGFTTCIALAQRFSPANEASMGIVCAIAAVIMFEALKLKEQKTCNFFPPVFVPATGICMLCIGAGWQSEVSFAFCLILFCLFTCLEIVNAHTTYAYSAYDSIRCLWELLSSRAGSATGVFVGWVLAYTAQYVFNINDKQFLVLCFLLVVILATIDGAFFKKQRMTLESTEDEENHLKVTFPKEAPKEFTSKGRWMQACDRLSEQYELSPRQKEIFLLLAKGRNVQFIKDELVLSTSTVKSHIYSIYQKMGIHSHQELIDEIECAVKAD